MKIPNSVIGNGSLNYWIILIVFALLFWFLGFGLEKDARRDIENAYRSDMIIEGNIHAVGPYEKALTKEDPSRHNR